MQDENEKVEEPVLRAPRGPKMSHRMEGEGRNKIAEFVDFSDESFSSDSDDGPGHVTKVGEGLGVDVIGRPSTLLERIQFTVEKKSS